MRFVALPLVFGLLGSGVAAGGCDDQCPDDYHCAPSGVHVRWYRDELFGATRAGVCVDDVCEYTDLSSQRNNVGRAFAPIPRESRGSVTSDSNSSSMT